MFKKFSSPVRKAIGLVALGLAMHSGLAAASVAGSVYNVGDLPQSQAFATAVTHNGSFADVFNFSLTSIANVSGAASLLNLDFGGTAILHIDSPLLTLTSASDPAHAIVSGSSSFFATNLNPGNYVVSFSGNANGQSGGNYLMGLYAAVTNPVPEPEQWGMLMAGLLAVGVLARRKQS